MSRSRKRPYAAICGNGSARYDKKLAGRGVRRKQNHWLRNQAHNNTWGWSRDGKQFLRLPTPQDRAYNQQWIQGRYKKGREENWLKKNYSQWPPRWYARLTRK
jgi:hypothetical protein